MYGWGDREGVGVFHSNEYCADVRADYRNRPTGGSGSQQWQREEYRVVGHVERDRL